MNLSFIILADQIGQYVSRFGYAGIYLWFITIDQIGPIPEEVTLIVIGYLSAQGVINPVFAGLSAIAGFITIDIIYFYLTKTGSKLVKKLTHNAKSSKGSEYEKKLKNNMLTTLLVISFIPRVRLLAPVFVALAKQPFRKFLFYSAISLSLFTAVYILLGIFFHSRLSALLEKAQTTGHIIFIAAMVLISAGFTVFAIRKFK
jgi:membrane-associated protein